MTTPQELSARSAVFYSFLGKYFGIGLQLVGSVILARLLTPEDFGIYSIAAVFSGLAQLLRDFGVSSYIVQEENLTTKRLRAAFSVQILSSWVLGAALFATSGLIGNFYRAPSVSEVLEIVSLNFSVLPLGSIVIALLNRKMNFRALAIINSISAAVGLVTTISLALAGARYMSLAWGAVAQTMATILSAQLFRPAGLPLLPGVSELTRVLSFSTFVSLGNVVGYLGDSVATLSFGKMFGASAVGIFSRAQGTAQMFNNFFFSALAPIAAPYIARVNRGNGSVRDEYLRLTTMVVAIAWPFFSFLGATSDSVIIVLFGEQWRDAGQLLFWMCVGRALAAPFQLTNSALIGLGDAKSIFILRSIVTITRITTVVVVIQFGLLATVIALSTGTGVVRAVAYARAIKRSMQVTALDHRDVVLQGGVLALLVGFPPVLVFRFCREWLPDAALLLISGTASVAFWLAGIYWMRSPLWIELRKVVGLVINKL